MKPPSLEKKVSQGAEARINPDRARCPVPIRGCIKVIHLSSRNLGERYLPNYCTWKGCQALQAPLSPG